MGNGTGAPPIQSAARRMRNQRINKQENYILYQNIILRDSYQNSIIRDIQTFCFWMNKIIWDQQSNVAIPYKMWDQIFGNNRELLL